MATRKPVHDPEALVEAVDLFADFIDTKGLADSGDAKVYGEDAAGNLFRYAEFETVTTKVAGEDVTMRRLVLTGEWAVQTN